MHRIVFVLVAIAALWNVIRPQSVQGQTPALVVTTDFAGGSAVVQQIDQEQRLVRILPAAHQDRGWVCWWYFHLTGIEPGETITLDVGEGTWATPDRAAYSVDQQTWRQTEPGKREGKRIVYRQRIDAREAWFAWGPPFVPADAQRLVDESAARCQHAKAFELCRTREDRPVPALRVTQPGTPDAEKRGVWIQARQHAWESGSSWVCQGFTEWLTSDDERAESLRRQAVVTIVPIMDVDNVAIGAGGKNQKPQDHNRDWSDEPHWNSVAAAQREIVRPNENGQFDLFVDLHNPGANDKHPYFYVAPRDLLSELGRRNFAEFVTAAKTEITGPLKFLGETRESGANYDPAWEQISKNWVTRHTRDHVVAVTLETAWNTPHSTTDNYRRVGRELGLAIERYFRTALRREINTHDR
jgi:hypothetical protein